MQSIDTSFSILPLNRATFRGLLATTSLLTASTPGIVRAQANTAPTASASASPIAYDPMHSVKDLKSAIAKVKAKMAEKERQQAAKTGKKPESKRRPERGGDEGEEATDILEAVLQQTQMRAFPNDRIDGAALIAAMQHRALMPAVGSSATAGAIKANGVPVGGALPPGGPSLVTTPWTFIGPKNTPPPYQIYFGPVGSIVTGRVNSIAYDPNTPNTVYLAANGGVWKSIDGGANWTVLSDGPVFKHTETSSIAIHPTTSRILLVGLGDFDGLFDTAYSTGIARSLDGGATWTQVSGSGMNGLAVSGIAFDPDNPLIVTATTGRGTVAGQIFRSIDGGNTWGAIGTAPSGDWSGLSIGLKGSNGKSAYYATLLGRGVYKSTDQGVTWSKLGVPLIYNNGTTTFVGLEVAASKLDPNVVYIIEGSPTFSDGRLFKGTFDPVANITRFVDITGNYPDGYGYNSLKRLSLRPGYNWSQSWYDLYATTGLLSVSGNTVEALYAGGITVSGSPTAGNLYNDIGFTYTGTPTAQTHSDQHAMAIDPFTVNHALFGNDGGIYGMTYNPATSQWSTVGQTTLNRTLGLTMVYHADWYPSNPSIMLGGTQDNATPAALGDINNWQNPGAGDGGGCAINPINANFQYTSTQNISVLGTTNMWASSSDITFYDTNGNAWKGEPTPFIGVMAVSPDSPNFLFIGTDHLWCYNQNTSTWIQDVGTTQLTSGGSVTAIGAAAKHVATVKDGNVPGGVEYVGTSDGKLWMTVNATVVDTSGNSTASWVEIDTPTQGGTPLPKRAITSINVNPNNAFDVTVTLSGTGVTHVWRCRDTFYAPVLSWADMSGNTGFTSLPDVPVNDVTRDPSNPDTSFFVATDFGVFMTTNSGADWQDATQSLGLPNVQCNSIKVANGFLNVATFGRGFWRIPMAGLTVPTSAPASLSTKVGLVRSGANIVVTLTISNSGGAAANVALNAATLTVGTNNLSPAGLPITIGNIAAGGRVTVPLTFPGTAGRAGTLAKISAAGTYTGGSFTVPVTQVRLP